MPITQYGSLASERDFETFSETLDFFYYEKVRADRIRQRSGELFKTLSNLKERAVRKAVNRSKELEDCRDKDKYKIYGDLIVANQYALQKGAIYYDLQNFYEENARVRVPADPSLSPMQNAQKYYKEYRKKQTAESRLSDFIKAANDEAAYLDSVTDALSRAQTDPEITEIKNELVQTGFLKRRPAKNQKIQSSFAQWNLKAPRASKYSWVAIIL